MLVIVMHNNQSYLDSLLRIAKREAITDATIIKRKAIGIRLIGGDFSFVFSRGKIMDAYDKAFIAVIKEGERTRHFLDLIERDASLDMLNIEDKGFICTVPFHYIKNLELELSSKKREEDKKMNLADLLKEDRILLNLKASNKEEAIKEIADTLKNSKEIVDFDSFLKHVFERESLNTTGIGNYIAIPHARTDAVKEFIVAFGRSSEGIKFGSLDNKPARLIFLMGTPKEKGLNSYLKILAHLTRLLSKEHFREALLRVSSPGEVVEEFRKIENQGR